MRSPVISAAVLAGVILAATPFASAETAPDTRPGTHRPYLAAGLSVGATAAWGLAASQDVFGSNDGLLLGTLIVAPAAGRWYVGELGLVGLAMRGTGIWLFAHSILGDGDTRPGFAAAGTLVFLGGAFYDVFGSAHAAHKQNQRRWTATPTVLATPHGSIAAGFALGGSF